MNETTYIDENDENHKLIVKHDSANNTTTVQMVEGNAVSGQGNNTTNTGNVAQGQGNSTSNTVDENRINEIIRDEESEINNAVGNEDAQVTIVYNKYTENMNPADIPSELKNTIKNILNSKPAASTGTSSNSGGKAKRSKKSAKKGKKSRGMKGKRGRRSAKKGRK